MPSSSSWRDNPQLISAARAGDEQALVSLLEAARPDVLRYARISCNSRDDADDAAQQTLWLLYRRLGTLRALTSLPAWLFTVVRRECLRLARLATGFLPSELLHRNLRNSTRPLHDLRLDLAHAIASLPDHYRQVVLLRDIEEMSIDEISFALSLTREATKARLHRARVLIREYLGDDLV